MTVLAEDAIVEVRRIYEGSDGDATRDLYQRLQRRGVRGEIAVNLFRAHKTSGRAKEYRGPRGRRGRGDYSRLAYDRKQWSIGNLCTVLGQHAAGLGIRWGWGVDSKLKQNQHVLYIDLPTGQVSFHSPARGEGPDYPGKWDGQRASGGRILTWVARVLDGSAA